MIPEHVGVDHRHGLQGGEGDGADDPGHHQAAVLLQAVASCTTRWGEVAEVQIHEETAEQITSELSSSWWE